MRLPDARLSLALVAPAMAALAALAGIWSSTARAADPAADAAAAPAAPLVFHWYDADLRERWSAPLVPPPPDVAFRPLEASPWRERLQPVDLPGFRGGTVPLFEVGAPASLIDVWASWCGPCRRELPRFQSLWERHRDAGIHAIAANLGESAQDALPFAVETGLTMPVVRMPQDVASALEIEGLPVLILADGDGRVVDRWNSYVDGMEDEVSEALERTIAGTDDAAEEVARVDPDGAALRTVWSRVAPDEVQGVVLLPPSRDGQGPRVAVVVQRTLLVVDADGGVLRRLGLGPQAGHLRSLVRDATGDPLVMGFRDGGSRLFFVDWSERAHDRWDAGVPVFDLELRERPVGAGDEARPEALIASLSGLLRWSPGDAAARPVVGFETVSAIERRGSAAAGWATLEPGKRLALLDETLAPVASTRPPADGWTLAAHPRLAGLGVAPDRVVGAAGGRMLAEAEMALTTDDGGLWIVDLADGRVLHRSVWPRPVLPAYGDLDGDGRDELLVAGGNRLTVLAPGPGERKPKTAESSGNDAQPGPQSGIPGAHERSDAQIRRDSAGTH